MALDVFAFVTHALIFLVDINICILYIRKPKFYLLFTCLNLILIGMYYCNTKWKFTYIFHSHDTQCLQTNITAIHYTTKNTSNILKFFYCFNKSSLNADIKFWIQRTLAEWKIRKNVLKFLLNPQLLIQIYIVLVIQRHGSSFFSRMRHKLYLHLNV